MIYLIEVIVSIHIIFTNRFYFTMPSQANIDAAQQRGDTACAAAIGLSLEEGTAAPVAATNTNLFAAAFGEFAAVPAAGGVGRRGHPRGL